MMPLDELGASGLRGRDRARRFDRGHGIFSLLRRAAVTISLLLPLVSCGEAPPPQPETDPGVSVSLSWSGTADLDLHVDGKSANQLGGSPDMTAGGGSEVYIFKRSDTKESFVVGVINRSAEPGGNGDTNIPATITITERSGRSQSLQHTMIHDRWNAFTVFPKYGTFAVYEEMKEP